MNGRELGTGLAALILAAAGSLTAQAQAPSPAASTAATLPVATAAAVSSTAPPFAPTAPENPFRRFEIVSLGAFPIMLFYSDFGFDLQRYSAHNFDSLYTPWPFKSPTSAPLTDSERYARIGVALGACVIVGAIDAYFHAMKVKKAKRLREALESTQP